MEQATFRILPAPQNDGSEVNFGEYYPVEDVTRNERGNTGELSSGDKTSLGNKEYRYNVLVLPDHFSNLDDQNKIYFEPKDISQVPINDTYNVVDSSSLKAELRNNEKNITPKDDFNGPISNDPKTIEPIENEDRSYTDQPHHELPSHGQQYQYDQHHEELPHGQQVPYEPHHREPSHPEPYQYNQHHDEPSRGQQFHSEPHQNEQRGEHYTPEQPTSYAYNYHVNGYPTGPIFSKHENSDGFLTRGEYSVKLPDGRTQTVSYSVKGEGGFTVNVRYSGNSFMGNLDFSKASFFEETEQAPMIEVFKRNLKYSLNRKHQIP